jgi:phage tail tape-measure protein
MKDLLIKCAKEMEEKLTRLRELQMILDEKVSEEEYDRLMQDPEVKDIADRVEKLINEIW